MEDEKQEPAGKLQLHFLVQDKRLHGFALDAIRGHGFYRRLRLHGSPKRIQVPRLHTDRDFIPGDREMDRRTESISPEQVAVRPEARFPLHRVLNLRRDDYHSHICVSSDI